MDSVKTYSSPECKIGTHLRLPDGREGTTVFNGLCGVGIKWGLHNPPAEDFKDTYGDLFASTVPDDFEWEADALLRDPWDGCERTGFTADQCVGEKFTIIREGGRK